MPAFLIVLMGLRRVTHTQSIREGDEIGMCMLLYMKQITDKDL